MKTINNKIKLQKNAIRVKYFRNKLELFIYTNLIGFSNDYFFPEENHYRNNFGGYKHRISDQNNKLYKKYPDMLKKLYKQWLKSFIL